MSPSLALAGFQARPYLKAGCEPFFYADGNEEVVCFIHGLTGSPADFRDFVQTYRAAGFDVAVPLLSGHGTHVRFLESLTYRELTIPLLPLKRYLHANYRRVHLTGLSYGAVLAADLCARHPPATLAMFAPAFFLSSSVERRTRWAKGLGLGMFQLSIPKKRRNPNRAGKPRNPLSYNAVPIRPMLALHERAETIRGRLDRLKLPVFHAHGDRDATTPMAANRRFLHEHLADYHFYHVKKGEHVITLDSDHLSLARAHMAWLETHGKRRV